LKRNKNYIKVFDFGDGKVEITWSKFDVEQKTILIHPNLLRIKIWELFFPFTFVRGFKLVVEVKNKMKYVPILEQYEMGDWDVNKFKEVIQGYEKLKGVIVPVNSVSSGNYETIK
jgi:hypothetical protein